MTETAIFGAGCFWGVEAAFRRVDGVVETAVGYAGGHTAKPSYYDVCSGQTGHAEVVRVVFDPERVSYEKLLELFWQVHDPTQSTARDRIRHPVSDGHLLRLRRAGRRPQKRARRRWWLPGHPIATQIEPAPEFWMAEDYHQQYFEKNRRIHAGLFRV